MLAGLSMLARLPLLMRIDARRGCLWISGMAAAVAAATLPTTMPTDLPGSAVAAVALGVVLAVAAVGFVPRTGSAALDATWIVARVAWPAVGWAAVALARGAPDVAAWGGLGIALGGGCLTALARLGLIPADAAGVGLAAAGVACAVGWWATAASGSERSGAMVSALALSVAFAGVSAVSASGRARAAARQFANHLLTGTAMAGALLGMVMWLFLVPDRAGLDLLASLAWFVSLALPAATLGDGVSHLGFWRRFERAHPVGAGWPSRLGPGRRRDAVRAPLLAAAILGWPPFVATVVGGFGGGLAPWTIAIVIALAVGALLVVATTTLGDAAGVRPDAQHAAALAAVGLAAVMLLRAGAGSFPAPLNSQVGGGWRQSNDVEKTRNSCHTASPAQSLAGLPARCRKWSRSGAAAHDMEWEEKIPTA